MTGNAYLIGAKQITIGASTVVEVNATSYQNGGIIKKVSASTIVSFVDGVSFAHTSGYPIAENEAISFDGPAKFFLAAAGVTATVTIMRSYSAGATGLPTLPPAVVGGLI